MRISLVVFLLVTSAIIYGQDKETSDSSLQVVYRQIREVTPKATIYYIENGVINSSILKDGLKKLSKRKINNLFSPRSNIIVLSKAERKYFIRELRNSHTFYWKDSLFLNSRSIPNDSAQSHIQRKLREKWLFRTGINNKDSLVKYSNEMFHSEAVFGFSNELFIRSGSVFLQYFYWFNGSGGSENLSFYKKENGEWKRWVVLSHGDY